MYEGRKRCSLSNVNIKFLLSTSLYAACTLKGYYMKFITLTFAILTLMFIAIFRLFELGDSEVMFSASIVIYLLILVSFSILSVFKFRNLKSLITTSSLLIIITVTFSNIHTEKVFGYSIDFVKSRSNNPTLMFDDLIISKHFNLKLQKGDMVGFIIDNKTLRKRIMATNNDQVIVCDNKTYINNIHFPAKNNWVQEAIPDNLTCNSSLKKFLIKKNEYFLLGDNIENSYDSRYFGPVKSESIIAESIYLITPDNETKNLSISDLLTPKLYGENLLIKTPINDINV